MTREIKPYKADAAGYAEQILTYFIHRDEMNAFIHYDNLERGVNVRYSPITRSAEAVLRVVWEDAFGVDVLPPNIASISRYKGS